MGWIFTLSMLFTVTMLIVINGSCSMAT